MTSFFFDNIIGSIPFVNRFVNDESKEKHDNNHIINEEKKEISLDIKDSKKRKREKKQKNNPKFLTPISDTPSSTLKNTAMYDIYYCILHHAFRFRQHMIIPSLQQVWTEIAQNSQGDDISFNLSFKELRRRLRQDFIGILDGLYPCGEIWTIQPFEYFARYEISGGLFVEDADVPILEYEQCVILLGRQYFADLLYKKYANMDEDEKRIGIEASLQANERYHKSMKLLTNKKTKQSIHEILQANEKEPNFSYHFSMKMQELMIAHLANDNHPEWQYELQKYIERMEKKQYNDQQINDLKETIQDIVSEQKLVIDDDHIGINEYIGDRLYHKLQNMSSREKYHLINWISDQCEFHQKYWFLIHYLISLLGKDINNEQWLNIKHLTNEALAISDIPVVLNPDYISDNDEEESPQIRDDVHVDGDDDDDEIYDSSKRRKLF